MATVFLITSASSRSLTLLQRNVPYLHEYVYTNKQTNKQTGVIEFFPAFFFSLLLFFWTYVICEEDEELVVEFEAAGELEEELVDAVQPLQEHRGVLRLAGPWGVHRPLPKLVAKHAPERGEK
jgi:hypothetical protein